MGFSQADQRLQLTWIGCHLAPPTPHLAHVYIGRDEPLGGILNQSGVHIFPGISKVVPKDTHVQLLFLADTVGLVVEGHKMAGEATVIQLVLRVKDEEDEVEARHEGVRQLNVLNDGLVFVPLRLERVGSGKDGGAGVELTDDASLGDAEGLLLHHLMKH